MLRRLETILPRLDRHPLNKDCATPTAGQPGQLSDLNNLLHQFSARFSALISQTQDFLAKVKQSTARLQDGRLCARGDFQNTIFATVEQILTDLSEFMRSVNPGQSTIIQRQTSAFQQKFRQMFQQVASSLNTAGLQQRCTGNTDTSSTPISTLAAALDDLAAIIEDVGVETFSRELGFDFDFNLDNILLYKIQPKLFKYFNKLWRHSFTSLTYGNR